MNKQTSCKLRILHFNDVYDFEKAGQFATQFMEHSDENTLRLFSGDLFNPSIVSIFEKGKQFIPLFRKIRPQCSAIGNHDLDFGEEHFIQISAEYPTKWLMCNLKRKSDGQNLGNASDFEILEVNGILVGIFGLMDENWITASDIDPAQYSYEPFLAKARELSKELRQQGCHFIIALTHMGTMSDFLLLEDDNEVDLILGGHDHHYILKTSLGKTLVKSGSNFEFFTRLDFDFQCQKSEIESYTNIECDKCIDYRMDCSNRQEYRTGSFNQQKGDLGLQVSFERIEVKKDTVIDAELQATIDRTLQDVQQKTACPLLKLDSEFDITFSHIRRRPSKVGMLLANLIRIKLRTDVVLLNAGHLRSECKYPAGSFFRMIDLFKLLPLYDHFQKFKASGNDFKELVEQGFQTLPNTSGSFPNLSGVDLTVQISQEPGSRLGGSPIEINGIPLIGDQIYTLAALQFVSKGKDGYTKFPQLEKVTNDKEVYPINVFREFLELPKVEAHRVEFHFFKQVAMNSTIDSLNVLFESVADKTYEAFTEENLKCEAFNVDSLLSKVSRECIERLQMYTQADSIVEVEDFHIFGLNPEEPSNVRIVE